MFDSRTPHGAGTSAFSQLDAPPERIFIQEAGRAKLLPTCCGTYAFHDGAGELLYIGKAKNVRARVLGHFREPGDSTLLLRPWTHRIARIEVRPAQSEMEALLVEADLIARLRPPFNRQMRSWSRYCYLLPTDDHASPLSISCQLQSWKRCFGPYRTRRQAVRIVEAVFRLVTRNGDADMLAKCYRLLGGETGSLLLDLERQQEALVAADKDESWATSLPRLTEILRKASERAVLLRDAERIVGGIMVLPGRAEPRTVAIITHSRLHLDAVPPKVRDAEAFLRSYRKWIAEEHNDAAPSLPKSVADCLCVAAKETARRARPRGFITAETASRLSPGELIGLLYDEGAPEPETQNSRDQGRHRLSFGRTQTLGGAAIRHVHPLRDEHLPRTTVSRWQGSRHNLRTRSAGR
jgi:hypothetical protein